MFASKSGKDDADILLSQVDKSDAPPASNKIFSASDNNEFFANNEDDPDPSSPQISPRIAFSRGLTSEQSSRLFQQHGPNSLPEKIVPKWYIFVSQLWQPMPIMIWLAALVEAAIQNWLDMGILLFIQFANASIAFYEITKAGKLIMYLILLISLSITLFSSIF